MDGSSDSFPVITLHATSQKNRPRDSKGKAEDVIASEVEEDPAALTLSC